VNALYYWNVFLQEAKPTDVLIFPKGIFFSDLRLVEAKSMYKRFYIPFPTDYAKQNIKKSDKKIVRNRKPTLYKPLYSFTLLFNFIGHYLIYEWVTLH